MSETKVVHLPFYDDNLYQTLLMRHLKEEGFDAIAGGGGGNFFRSVLRRWNARLLHFHWLHPYMSTNSTIGTIRRSLSFLAQITVLRMAGQKIVWTAHNLKHHESQNVAIERFFLKLFVRLCHAVIAHGETAKQELMRFTSLRNSRKIHVIPHGNYIGCYPNEITSQQARAQLKLPNSETVFLFLGQIRPYKGVLELLEAFEQLSRIESQVRLIIAGKPLNEEASLAIEKRAELLENVDYRPGFVPDEQLQIFMNAADVVVFPYRDILTSGAVILAMSFGRACIAPSLGYIREVLDENGAFVYDSNLENGLIQAMREALLQRENLTAFGDYNRRKAESWNWQSVAAQTAQIYRMCLRETAGAT